MKFDILDFLTLFVLRIIIDPEGDNSSDEVGTKFTSEEDQNKVIRKIEEQDIVISQVTRVSLAIIGVFTIALFLIFAYLNEEFEETLNFDSFYFNILTSFGFLFVCVRSLVGGRSKIGIARLGNIEKRIEFDNVVRKREGKNLKIPLSIAVQSDWSVYMIFVAITIALFGLYAFFVKYIGRENGSLLTMIYPSFLPIFISATEYTIYSMYKSAQEVSTLYDLRYHITKSY